MLSWQRVYQTATSVLTHELSPYHGHDKAKLGELQAIQHKLTYSKCREDLCYKALKLTWKPTSLAVLKVWPHSTPRDNHFPSSAYHLISHTSQDAIVPLGHLGTLQATSTWDRPLADLLGSLPCSHAPVGWLTLKLQSITKMGKEFVSYPHCSSVRSLDCNHAPTFLTCPVATTALIQPHHTAWCHQSWEYAASSNVLNPSPLPAGFWQLALSSCKRFL